MTPPAVPSRQPEWAYPTATLLTGQVLATAAAAVLWVAGTLIGGFGTTILVAGLIEIGLVTAIAVLGTLAIRPWVVRPAGTWAVMLIATSLVRIVVIAGLSVLLYSAARMAPKALLVSGFLAILGILIVETLITARFQNRLSMERSTADR
ncbi:MAG: hypothetical protein MK116_02615 [Phycisphaerales bacterium]|nr:hypothetical protein [Phycisphaerales bacterium]